MQRVAVKNGSQHNRSRRNTLIGSLLVCCIVGASVAGLWIYTTHRTNTQTPVAQVNAVKPYTGHRSNEVPLTSARSVAMVQTNSPTSSIPWSLVLDPSHGYVWVAEPGCDPLPACPTAFPSAIGQYAYSDGTFIQDFMEPKGYTGPLFIVLDPAGHLWFTQPNSDAIGEFDPINDVWQQWSVKKNAHPYDLIIDTRGNLWFTEWGGNQIGFFDTHTHTLVETVIPTAHTNPYGITLDVKGTVWFAENSAVRQIASFTATANGKIQIVEHTVTALSPHLITTDNAGNVWFTEGFSGFISEYNPVTGADRRFLVYLGACLNPATCTGTHISGIRVDNNGNVWFSDSLSQRVGYLVPSTGQIVTRSLKPNSHPHDGLVLDNNQRIWFTEEYGLQLNMWPMSIVK